MGMAKMWLSFWTILSMIMMMMMLGGLAEAGIGVNWGTMASHPIPPKIVVQMLKDNGLKKVKLFDADSDTLKALAGSGIEVMVAIPNDQLSTFADSYSQAQDWVKENVTKYLFDGGVDIRYAAVGNEPFLTSYNGSFLKTTFPSLKNVQRALDEAGVGDKIKATIPLNADVYESSSDKPSDGKFRDDIKKLMTDIVKFLNDNKAPFVVNIYPFLSLYQNPDFPLDFAFLDGQGKPIQDNNVKYDNVLDANYDTLVQALKKAGVPDLKIIVGEVGWPTDADKHASITLAKRFYDGLFKKLAKKDGGTPLRPGELEVYLFSLYDEDQKSIAPGIFERHWGIFQYDGQPKFPMDMSGKGNDKMLVGAKGIEYLEKQWCVLKKEVANESSAKPEISYACAHSDCTILEYSCDNLNAREKVSYGFNMYFQMQDQSVEACRFDGMAEITTTNPSKGGCNFPIMIVSAAPHPIKLGFGLIASLLLSIFMFV